MVIRMIWTCLLLAACSIPLCFFPQCRGDDEPAIHRDESNKPAVNDGTKDLENAPLLTRGLIEWKDTFPGLEATGRFVKPGCKNVYGETTPIADYDLKLERTGRCWIENLMGVPETDFELRLISVGRVTEPTAVTDPLFRFSYRMFYRGIRTSDDAYVDLRKGDVETAYLSLHVMQPVKDSEKPLISRQEAAKTLRLLLDTFPNTTAFEDKDLTLEYRPTLYTNEKGKRKLCLAPFWDLKNVTFQVHALTGELNNND